MDTEDKYEESNEHLTIIDDEEEANQPKKEREEETKFQFLKVVGCKTNFRSEAIRVALNNDIDIEKAIYFPSSSTLFMQIHGNKAALQKYSKYWEGESAATFLQKSKCWCNDLTSSLFPKKDQKDGKEIQVKVEFDQVVNRFSRYSFDYKNDEAIEKEEQILFANSPKEKKEINLPDFIIANTTLFESISKNKYNLIPETSGSNYIYEDKEIDPLTFWLFVEMLLKTKKEDLTIEDIFRQYSQTDEGRQQKNEGKY